MLRIPLVALLVLLACLALAAVASAEGPPSLCADGSCATPGFATGTATTTGSTFSVSADRSYRLGNCSLGGAFEAQLPRPRAVLRTVVGFPFRLIAKLAQ